MAASRVMSIKTTTTIGVSHGNREAAYRYYYGTYYPYLPISRPAPSYLFLVYGQLLGPSFLNATCNWLHQITFLIEPFPSACRVMVVLVYLLRYLHYKVSTVWLRYNEVNCCVPLATEALERESHHCAEAHGLTQMICANEIHINYARCWATYGIHCMCFIIIL